MYEYIDKYCPHVYDKNGREIKKYYYDDPQDGGVFLNDSDARWPYFQMRGKPVTPEQAMEMLIRTSDRMWSSVYGYNHSSMCAVSSTPFRNGVFGIDVCNRTTWVHPDGTIGQNSFLYIKNAFLCEVTDALECLIKEFPYLDFVAGVTCVDDALFAINNFEKIKSGKYPEWDKFQNEGFLPVIEYGIHVHDSIIEIVDADTARELYTEYERLYEVADKALYEEDYYTDLKQLDWEYLVEAVRLVKLPNAEEFLKKYAEKLEEEVSRISDPYKQADNNKFLFDFYMWERNLLASKHEYDLKNQRGD